MLFVCTVYSVLYSEIAVSRKPFGIGHMCIYTFLLGMTDTMTSQNTDPSAWDILYVRKYSRKLILILSTVVPVEIRTFRRQIRFCSILK
jgi:hypothetical protein